MTNRPSKNFDLTFKSERLLYRPLAQDDVELSVEIWSDPEITKYMGGAVSREELIADHHKYMRRCADGAIGVWTLTTLDEGEKIGTAILLPMPIQTDQTDWELLLGKGLPDALIEVGYALKKGAWGKGYATEACKALIDFGFLNTQLEEIVACTDARNLASGHVLMKSGLVREEDRLSYGEICPFFRITRAAWSAERKHD